MWVLPSLRLSPGWRQVPFRALRVFHAWAQVLVSYCRPLPPAVPAEVAVLIGTAGCAGACNASARLRASDGEMPVFPVRPAWRRARAPAGQDLRWRPVRPCAVPQMGEPGGDGTAGPGDLAGEAAAPATFKLLANPRRGLAGYLAAAAAAAGPVQQMAHAVSPHWHLIRPQPAARVVSGMTRRAARRGWPPEHRDPGSRPGRLHGEGSSCTAALTIQAPAHPRARPRGLPPAACRNTP
jgi:hypothetical protein